MSNQFEDEVAYEGRNGYDDSETQDVAEMFHQQEDDSETQDVGEMFHQEDIITNTINGSSMTSKITKKHRGGKIFKILGASDRVKETIDWSHPWVASLESKIKKKVRSKLNERWKHCKSQLRKKWYKPFLNSPLRFQKPDDDRLDDRQWKIFVANMDKKKHQISLSPVLMNYNLQLCKHNQQGNKHSSQSAYNTTQLQIFNSSSSWHPR
ncbi:hypothetical protein M0R45_031001 [Rubus argutus]|uniref:Uncharacterized protein n=1 Tax=Rubus argutus TaxID=59490 RepID=A0AAW1WCL7_RUBAR